MWSVSKIALRKKKIKLLKRRIVVEEREILLNAYKNNKKKIKETIFIDVIFGRMDFSVAKENFIFLESQTGFIIKGCKFILHKYVLILQCPFIPFPYSFKHQIRIKICIKWRRSEIYKWPKSFQFLARIFTK